MVQSMLKSLSVFIAASFAIFGILFTVFIYHNSGLIIWKKQRMVLIVLDAFRHDYLEVARSRGVDLPNLNNMVTNGARIMKVNPAFPTVTMPNHQTLVTGLYTPYHGITHNTFNDSGVGDIPRFAMGDQSSLNDPRWYKDYPHPFWVTCEKRKPLCKSGSMLWPNTDAMFDGIRPSESVGQYWALNQKPNNVYPYERRVDELVGWMKEDLVNLGLLYFDEPDATSHEYGPLNEKTLDKVKEMDSHVGRLIAALEREGLLGTTDLVLTGDHGMTDLSPERVIDIDNFVPPNLYRTTYSSPVGIIYPNEGKFDEVFALYSKASEHIKVYKRENVPLNLHYRDNSRRISPIVTIVDLGWFVKCSHYNDVMHKGSHGYSPYEDDMKTTLLAMGPSFRHVTLNSSRHVDVYPLFMHLLGLKPNPHNGSFERISPTLKDKARQWIPVEDRWTFNRPVLVIYLLLTLQMLLSFFFLLVLICPHKRRPHLPDRIARYDPEQSVALITSE